MISKLRAIIIYILCKSRAILLLRFLHKNDLYLIGYHSIALPSLSRTELYNDLVINPEDFERHLQTLVSLGHTFIKPGYIKDIKKINLPTIIYFDDAYLDVYEFAVPILEKYQIKPIIFVPTDLVGGSAHMWSIKERYLLNKQGLINQEIEERIRYLRSLDFKTRDSELTKGEMGDVQVFMNWNKIVELSAKGYEIGSHTVTHTRLNELSVEQIKHELINSKSIIEDHIHRDVSFFSYPGGRVVSESGDIIKDTGYEYAVTTVSGSNVVPLKDNCKYLLKKISPKPGESITTFYARLYAQSLFK